MKYIYLLLSICFFLPAKSQLNIGEYNTPYSGAQGLKYNPAEIVDSRYKFHMSLIDVSTDFDNNYVGFSKNGIRIPFPNITDSNKFDYLIENTDGKPKHAYMQSNFSALNFMLAFKKSSMGFQAGMNTLVTGSNFDERFARYMLDNKNPLRWGPTNSKDISLNATSWAYFGLTYGREIINKNRHYLKFAITGKLNFGLANTYMTSKDLYVNFSNQNTISKANGNLNQQFSASFTDTSGKFDPASISASNIGGGADIGFIYERRDKGEYNYTFDCKDDNIRMDQNKYAIRAGISLIDFGAISFKPQTNLRGLVVDSNLFLNPISTDVFDNVFNYDEYIDSLTKYGLNGIILDTTLSNYSMWTPTTFNAFVDVHIWKGFYAALNTSVGFVLNNNAGSRIHKTRFTLVPKYDSKWFGFYLPASYSLLSKQFSLGAGFRLAMFNFGVSDWLTAARIKPNMRNVGFYASMNIPFPQRKHPKDKDHDLMSNKMDECKNDPGDCNTGGCPDPDDDGDGVTNTMDKCINTPGLPEFDGCPDTDKDGVPDKDDLCPRDKGIISLGGCPDTDGDGVPDKDDKCPKEAGPKDYEGCPDTDEDGIPNHLDECPFEKGTFEDKGCPEKKDVDTDKDGLNDDEDKCPNEFGPKSNDGCPISQEALTLINVARENLEFHTGSSVIRKESYSSLEMLTQYLLKYNRYKVEISGHTDDVGTAENNMRLSQARANSVRTYFIQNGVDPSRITATGYGESRPIGDNNTESGRAINRRVEIELK